MAPSADRVPYLMKELFEWLNNSKDHLLIRSCVFHYEFEFIHPFIDGNGRMGRLWQSLILSKLNPIFEHLPVENMVHANQQQYYDAITRSNEAGNSGKFIDFMLGEILNTLEVHKGNQIIETDNKVPDKTFKAFPEIQDSTWNIYMLLKSNGNVTTDNMATIIGISDRMVRKHMAILKEKGLITRIGSNRKGYWKVNEI